MIQCTTKMFVSPQCCCLHLCCVQCFKHGFFICTATLASDSASCIYFQAFCCLFFQQSLSKETWGSTSTKTIGLLGMGKLGGWEFLYLTPTRTPSPSELLCSKAGSCVSHFNVSLIVWAKSQDSVHKPQLQN